MGDKMPFVIEQKSEPEVVVNTKTESDPMFGVIVVGFILLYMIRGIVFSALKLGFIGVLGFTLYNFIR